VKTIVVPRNLPTPENSYFDFFFQPFSSNTALWCSSFVVLHIHTMSPKRSPKSSVGTFYTVHCMITFSPCSPRRHIHYCSDFRDSKRPPATPPKRISHIYIYIQVHTFRVRLTRYMTCSFISYNMYKRLAASPPRIRIFQLREVLCREHVLPYTRMICMYIFR